MSEYVKTEVLEQKSDEELQKIADEGGPSDLIAACVYILNVRKRAQREAEQG